MTLEQQAAQLLWCGWGMAPEAEPRAVNEHARWLVEELQAGGLILFTRNLGSPGEVAALANDLRPYGLLPPLIGVDQEGGRVCRLTLPGLTFPGNMALGALDDPARTRAVSRAIGEQLAALGIGVNFAPVLDVNNNPANPVIGVRSFGEDPEHVARHGVAALEGYRDAGILPVPKHFPGHGDTGVDSHLDLPLQPASRERLERVELVPFRAAVAAGCGAIMTSHILFPALDPRLPATLSPALLTGLLRRELGFKGLIVTDCLEMQAIADRWPPEETAVLAIEAGADMLLVCHTREVQARMHAALCGAVRSGRLPEQRLAESVQRVQAAREQVTGVSVRAEPERVGTEPYRALEARVAEESLTVVGETRLEALDRRRPVVVSGSPYGATRLAGVLSGRGFSVRTAPPEEGPGRALEPAEQLVWTVLPRDPFAGGRPPEAAAGWLAERPGTAVVCMGEPYPLAFYPSSCVRLAAWGAQPPHLQAAARWLAGEVTARGRLPVRLALE